MGMMQPLRWTLARELVGGREECGVAEVGQVRLGRGRESLSRWRAA